MIDSLALFVSEHGFGHAARATALVDALWRQRPHLQFHWFGSPPARFLEASTSAPVHVHATPPDVGLVQRDALTIDHAATLEALGRALPPRHEQVRHLVAQVRQFGCAAVVCDIAPLGLGVAGSAGIPGILLENFTWDWIYSAYCARFPAYQSVVEWMTEQVATASLHIQCEPVCRPNPRAVRVPPIARATRAPASIRPHLGVDEECPLVLVSMGGLPCELPLPRTLAGDGAHFVLMGEVRAPETLPTNVTCLPQDSNWYHPDLVAAADLVVGKLGYSTVAEALASGTGYAYVERQDFPESAVLAGYVDRHLDGRKVPERVFRTGDWPQELRALLVRRRGRKSLGGGAAVAAAAILDHVDA